MCVVSTHDRDFQILHSNAILSTSPLIYVRFPAVSAHDSCATVGPPRYSITLAFAPGELSTFEFDKIGPGSYTTLHRFSTLPICRVGPGTKPITSFPIARSNSSTYQSLIVLPSKLLEVVPAWATCVADMFEGQDPPRNLSPVTAMVP